MRLFKLTDEQNYTRKGCFNETLWGEGTSHTAEGDGGLCSSGVIHAYEHPLLAAFMNPAHSDIKDPILWEAEGDVVARQGQLKCGVKSLTTLRRIDLPVITREQRVEIAIRCSLEVYKEPKYVEWAHKWLSGEDRSAKSAVAASRAAAKNAYAAYHAAEAAVSAARADTATAAALSADAAAWADTATAAAAAAGGDFDLLSIIQKVVKERENSMKVVKERENGMQFLWNWVGSFGIRKDKTPVVEPVEPMQVEGGATHVTLPISRTYNHLLEGEKAPGFISFTSNGYAYFHPQHRILQPLIAANNYDQVWKQDGKWYGSLAQELDMYHAEPWATIQSAQGTPLILVDKEGKEL